MANDYGVFDYMIDVYKGDMPGPLAMRGAPEDTGPLGEYLVKHVLDNAWISSGYPMFKNLVVPNCDSRVGSAEIDVLMLAREGVYVFESKNYGGWIFGRPDEQTWTASYSKTKKYSFYNPILQNRTHVKALAAYLGLPESVFHSFIVFSQRCELKKIPAPMEGCVVCRRPNLRKMLTRDMKLHQGCFTFEEVRELNRKISALVGSEGEGACKGHIERIKAVERVCPWCGRTLVERRRKSDGAAFVGCSGYPECRYVRSEW